MVTTVDTYDGLQNSQPGVCPDRTCGVSFSGLMGGRIGRLMTVTFVYSSVVLRVLSRMDLIWWTHGRMWWTRGLLTVCTGRRL